MKWERAKFWYGVTVLTIIGIGVVSCCVVMKRGMDEDEREEVESRDRATTKFSMVNDGSIRGGAALYPGVLAPSVDR